MGLSYIWLYGLMVRMMDCRSIDKGSIPFRVAKKLCFIQNDRHYHREFYEQFFSHLTISYNGNNIIICQDATSIW